MVGCKTITNVLTVSIPAYDHCILSRQILGGTAPIITIVWVSMSDRYILSAIILSIRMVDDKLFTIY